MPAAAAPAAFEFAGATAEVVPPLPPQLATSAVTRTVIAGPILEGTFLEIFMSALPSIQRSASLEKFIHPARLILVNGLPGVSALTNAESNADAPSLVVIGLHTCAGATSAGPGAADQGTAADTENEVTYGVAADWPFRSDNRPRFMRQRVNLNASDAASWGACER